MTFEFDDKIKLFCWFSKKRQTSKDETNVIKINGKSIQLSMYDLSINWYVDDISLVAVSEENMNEMLIKLTNAVQKL